MSLSDYTVSETESRRMCGKLNLADGVRVFTRNKDGGSPFMISVHNRTTGVPKFKVATSLEDAEKKARDILKDQANGINISGKVTLKTCRDLLHTRLVDGQRDQDYIDEIMRVLDAAIESGVNDLQHELLIPKTKHFLATYRPRSGFGKDGKRSSGTGKEWSNSQMGKTIGYFRQAGDELLMTVPRPLMPYNPFCALIKPPKTKTVMDSLSVAESKLLVTDESLARSEGLWVAYRLYTGQRQREASWIRWEHINFAGKRIRIRKADQMDIDEAAELAVNKSRIAKGKRAKAVKKVKYKKERNARLPDELAEILMKVMPPNATGYVFDRRFRSRDDSCDGRAIRNHLKACGIDHWIRPHDLRSTNACLMMLAGLEEGAVQRHLGHADKEMTQHYNEKSDELEEEAKADGWFHCGEISLRKVRSGFGKGSPEPVKQGSSEDSNQVSPEDDIGDDWFVVVPSIEGLTVVQDLVKTGQKGQ